MEKWKIRERAEKIEYNIYPSLHPVALELLFKKGIRSEDKIRSFLFPDYEKDIADPFLFSDMEKATGRIFESQKNGEIVAVFGDYDADGVTAAAVVEEALKNMGIKTVIYLPDKKLEGYGMNLEALKELKKKKVKLIITVDCGISNKKEIEEANRMGMDVIITDHHHVPDEIPPALAVINPHLKNSGYLFKDLAGVGVAFKLVQGLYEKFLPKEKEQLKWMLDLVAIGTVADCVSLTGENRAIVRYGLIVLGKTRRVGLQEIFKVGRILIDENNFPDAHKIAFQIAPRLNAAGRMDHASIAYRLIIEPDRVKARQLALDLEAKNQERQKMTGKIVDEVRILAQNIFKNKKFIFAVGEHFSISVAGLVAGKIADEFLKPTAVIQKGESVSQGSFRSIPSVNIIEAIEKCRRWLIKYGGHSQAAGISVRNENLEKFYEAMDKLMEKELKKEEIDPVLEIDRKIDFGDIDFELARALKNFEPFGEDNEEPIFLTRNIIVEEIKTVGNGNQHLKIYLRGPDHSPKIFEAIGFGMGSQFAEMKVGSRLDIVYNLRLDAWNSSEKIQLRLIDIKIN
jgi:single-stranded-DNA-specific exonuclease